MRPPPPCEANRSIRERAGKANCSIRERAGNADGHGDELAGCAHASASEPRQGSMLPRSALKRFSPMPDTS
jgi:hypothetical protein